MNNKLVVLLLCFCAGWITGCSRQSIVVEGGLTVVTSFYPIQIATLNVVGNIPGVRVVSMAQGSTGCLHDYQMTPRDMALISHASVLVINGAGMESFLDKVTARSNHLRVVDASTGIPLLSGAEGTNPHVWLSVSNEIAQVKNIAEGLMAADTLHASIYRANAAAYIARLDSLRTRIASGLTQVSYKRIVTFHDAFPYFTREFGLEVAAVIEREPGSEPSAADLANIILTVRSASVGVLFIEPQYPARAAETIARETGATLAVLDPAVTGPVLPNAYIQIMESNLAVLRKALK